MQHSNRRIERRNPGLDVLVRIIGSGVLDDDSLSFARPVPEEGAGEILPPYQALERLTSHTFLKHFPAESDALNSVFCYRCRSFKSGCIGQIAPIPKPAEKSHSNNHGRASP